MKKYVWKSQELKKKNNTYSWLMLSSMIVALLCLWFLPSVIEGDASLYAIFAFMGLALIFMWKSMGAKADDKKMKK